MLRSALLLGALIASATFSLAQDASRRSAPPTPAAQNLTQPRAPDAPASATSSVRKLPYPDMMSTWEYSEQEWK